MAATLLFLNDGPGARLVPHVHQRQRGLQHDGQPHAIQKAGLVRQRRAHEHGIAAGQAQPFDVGQHIGEQGVGGVHHALGHAGGAGGVEQLHDLVSRQRRIEGRRVAGRQQDILEAFGTVVADHHQLLEVRQPRSQRPDQRRMIKPPEQLGHDDHARLRVGEHERQLALAENRHHRIADRAAAQAAEVDGHEFPPVGQLERHHVATLHAES